MLSLLTTRLALYVYSDSTPDSGYDNATYTFSTYVWGRVDRKAAKDSLTAGAAVPHRRAVVTMRDSISVQDFALVVEADGSRWRLTGQIRRTLGRMTQYEAEYAPQFTLTASATGP